MRSSCRCIPELTRHTTRLPTCDPVGQVLVFPDGEQLQLPEQQGGGGSSSSSSSDAWYAWQSVGNWGSRRVLVAESLGTAREAVMRQHRGKALLANGEAERAIEDFQQAVELRRTADTVLLDSAEQALVVARGRVTIR
jgi:hypothetical protein